jgi:RNase adaptor protein for sRNA GlmZ degradation
MKRLGRLEEALDEGRRVNWALLSLAQTAIENTELDRPVLDAAVVEIIASQGTAHLDIAQDAFASIYAAALKEKGRDKVLDLKADAEH